MKTIDLKSEGQDSFFVTEAYKFIRTNIQFCGEDIKTIAVTSVHENEGKSTTAVNIAKSFAEMGKKVLLIDADMRKSVLAGRNFKSGVCAGLSEYLSGQEKEEENYILLTSVENFSVILAGVYPPNPTELLSSKAFKTLMTTSRKAYDYVIVDTPPLGVVTDAAIIAAKCDGAVLVIGGEKIDRKEASEVVSRLRQSGTRLLGVIRNKTVSSGKSYTYYKHKSSGRKKKRKSLLSWKKK